MPPAGKLLDLLLGNARRTAGAFAPGEGHMSARCCSSCSAPRPAYTDLRTCSYCGVRFVSDDVSLAAQHQPEHKPTVVSIKKSGR